MIVLAGSAYVVSPQLWIFTAWMLFAITYVGVGWALAWSGERQFIAVGESRRILRWSWIPPIVSSVTGITSAVVALGTRDSIAHDLESAYVAGAASIGIILSWLLLNAGFAKMYQAIDASEPERSVYFPDEPGPTLLSYIYFAFTVGTSFGTGDAAIRSVRIRRTAVTHSVVSFFYNALVVAVAFQILQQIVASGK
ncbi:DUF1345 domain-containing protein [Paenarthrobacter sp. NPDC090520]|uniref:DUF1345 domain-containing protein n=1 Tax=Paenarthrobacter sp. NPDC090520 TaxID=3364382 RepID=UPI003815BBD1